MQETSTTPGSNILKKIVLSALVVFAFCSGFSFALAQVSRETNSLDEIYPVGSFSKLLHEGLFSPKTISRNVIGFAHGLPSKMVEAGSMTRQAVQSVPTDLASNISPTQTLP